MLYLLLACGTPSPAVAPVQVAPVVDNLGDADAVAGADLDGDGQDELIRVVGTQALWRNHTQELGGVFQRQARGTLRGSSSQVALIATGAGRAMREVPMRVWALDADGAHMLWEEHGPRAQITDLRVLDGRVFVARFTDTRTVTSGFIEAGQIIDEVPAHMGMRQLPLADGRRVVGRLYGEQPRSDGDLRLGDRVLPSLRGVRSLAAADLDQDGDVDLLVGDGWHSEYGKRAVARLELLPGPDWDQPITAALLDDSYAIEEIQVVGGSLLATGSGGVHWLTRGALGWQDQTLAPLGTGDNATWLRTPGGIAVVTSGQPVQVLSPERAPAPRR